MSSYVLIQNLNKKIGNKEILKNISMQVNEGEVHAFIGHNGAGKTTTIRCMLGLIKYDGGRCTIFGEDPYHFSNKAKLRIGAVLDEGGLYDELNAEDNMLFFGSLYGMKRTTILSSIKRLSNLLELELDPSKKLAFYSKGMKQKLALIRELMHNPQLLVLDEPFNGLDPGARLQLRGLLKKLNDDGMTIFLSSHDLYDVEQVSDKVTLIKAGSTIKSDSLKVLKESHEYVAVLAEPVEATTGFDGIAGIEVINYEGHTVRFKIDKNQISNPLQELIKNNINVLECYSPKIVLEDYFHNTNSNING